MNEKEPQGHRATVILEWDYTLGPAWLKPANLENLLFTPLEADRGFLRVVEFAAPHDPKSEKESEE